MNTDLYPCVGFQYAKGAVVQLVMNSTGISIKTGRNQTEYNPNEAKWNQVVLKNLQISFSIIPEFINEEEEMSLIKEVEPYLKSLVYSKYHWDEAIHSVARTNLIKL